ncbi:MAG TPA: hypothetical protein DGR97_05175 [Gammaproteobacteria bacterium]|nr:hypothetical protein [Gammaproteobacteria bacterium]
MAIELVQEILGWCLLINVVLLLIWFLFIVFANDWMFRIHTRWFKLSSENFDAIHYAGIGLFEMGIVMFNVVPYLALRIAS